MVVGRFDSVGVAEGPQCWPALEEVAREVAVVLGARALAGGALEQCAQLVLERGDLRLQPGPVAVGLVEGVRLSVCQGSRSPKWILNESSAELQW